MAATFAWDEDTGVLASGKGTTRTPGVTDVNWKNSGVQGDVYSSFPIADGSNSFEKWQFGHFSGTYNNILNGLFAHTLTAFGAGLTLKGPPLCTGDGNKLAYTTPAAATNAALTNNMTSAIAIGSGVAVAFGATGPEATGKAASIAANPAYTNYLTTQLQTSGASPGDTAVVTLTLRYDEN